MNVDIRHNGTSIRGFVRAYERVHKICSGIGTLTVEVIRTINRNFNPWDTIDIYENGDFQVRYYISSTVDSVPDGIILLDCQDKSKRLVDYFIPDSYTIDYPSYTRYWIEKFLEEAGISYDFRTTSQGNLLSNYTQLGLAPAYEQIQTLLQLSGWYMFFDSNGVAIIGPLDVNLSEPAGNVGRTDILQISRVSDDKMLRNRAVVWGSYDPLHNQYAYADVRVNTPWNYDSRDLRTMVVSNQNIPNISSAYGIANTLLREFAKITIEKHLTLWGARGWSLGLALRVSSSVWTGRGLITTYGVVMNKDGLVTNVILDERCPRLYGFFDFGDYVYVGTYGDGVWRKHIRFDPTWYNFSSGLTDLAITDLHINYDVFGAVSASGDLYYASTSEGPWNKVAISSLMSSQENEVASGAAVNYVPYSGLMGRATIVDKLTNTVKYGIDNWSGVNYGDYFMQYSGSFASGIMGGDGSGVMSSGTYRGWIMECDPFTGQPVGGLGSGIYPINLSGNYSMRVIDLENDGVHDYVSVATSGLLIEQTEYGYNFGKHTSSVYPQITQDAGALVGVPLLGDFSGTLQAVAGTLSTTALAVSVYDNESIQERQIVWISGGSAHRLQLNKTFNTSTGKWEITGGTTTNSPGIGITGKSPFNITKISDTVYRCWFGLNVGRKSNSLGSSTSTAFKLQLSYKDWDTSTNTVGGEIAVIDYETPNDPNYGSSNEGISISSIIIGTKLYSYQIRICNTAGATFGSTLVRNYIEVRYIVADLVSGDGSVGLAGTFDFHEKGVGSGTPQWNVVLCVSQGLSFNGFEFVFQNGTSPNVAFFVRDGHNDNPLQVADYFEAYNYLIYSLNGIDFNMTEVQHADESNDPDFVHSPNTELAKQLTGEHYLVYHKTPSSVTVGGANKIMLFNGSVATVEDLITVPFHLQASNIYPVFGINDATYIAKNGSSWYHCHPYTLEVGSQFVPAPNYTIIKPYSTTDSIAPWYYWQALDTNTGKNVILQASQTSTINVIRTIATIPTSNPKAFIVGNFFIDHEGSNTGSPASYLFINNVSGLPSGTKYLVLQRDGADFHLIEEEPYPIRVDISNSSPLLTVGSGPTSFHSHIIAQQELITITPAGISPSGVVQDYRYALLDSVSGVASTSSGLGLGTIGLYVDGGGVYADDIMLYSGFQPYLAVPSGYGNRIETSNFVSSGQYVFVTTSGDNPMFYQKDPAMMAFVAFSGLPVSRATIIRLDDYL